MLNKFVLAQGSEVSVHGMQTPRQKYHGGRVHKGKGLSWLMVAKPMST